MSLSTQNRSLIPSLPDDVASLILSFLPYPHHNRLKTVSKSWKQFLSCSKTLFLLRSRYPRTLSHLLCIFPQDPSISSPCLFDPRSLAWSYLPPMPCNPHVYGLSNFNVVFVGFGLYVLGGSHFDTRSYPLDRPSPSSAVFRFDFLSHKWEKLAPMLSPRGSFACVAVGEGMGGGRVEGKIVVAGGGSRHTMFCAAGSRMSSVEMYDIGRNEWVALDGLPRFRAGCTGFLNGEREFWVMGGYGESRTISGMFPVDEYYWDAVVMDLGRNGGGRWTELGDMWEEGERKRLGRIAVLERGSGVAPDVFMLDERDICRYDMASNRWSKVTTVPRKSADYSPVGFVALEGELYVMALKSGIDCPEIRNPIQRVKSVTVFIQIYHPGKRTWRSLITKPPFHHPLDFKTAVMCVIRL